MTTPWDVSTATYETKFKDISGEEITPRSLSFKPDGAKMYVLGYTNKRVFQYSLATPWDVSTATYETKFKYVGSEDSDPRGLFFKADGTKMYVAGYTNKKVFQYSLSTPWDVSTATYETKFKYVGSEETKLCDLFFKTDGAKMYVLGYTNKRVFQYSLATPWDVSTATYETKFKDVSGEENDPHALFFKTDGAKMYVLGYVNDTVFQYSLPPLAVGRSHGYIF